MATNGSRQLVTISCETTALTTLPDALLDDDTISPLAKVAYWYLKRHGGQCRASEVATAIGLPPGDPWVMRDASVWPLLEQLETAGWLVIHKDPMGCALPRLTVHEVPGVGR